MQPGRTVDVESVRTDRSQTAEERYRREQSRLSARGMYLLTGGMTSEGDSFLIAVAAAIGAIVLYPLVGAWAFIVFPVALIAAVWIRHGLRRRRDR